MKKFYLLCTTAVGAALLTGAAQAQAAPPPTVDTEPKTLTEVVVTATRRDEKVLDVPYNISAVTGKQIENGQIQSSTELLRSVPGVSLVDRGTRNQGTATNIQMRGVNVDAAALGDYWVPTVAPVSTYVNDTPLFANFALIDIDRVEILRGPQGTLYGSGSLGGTVRYISNKPQFDRFSGSASVTGSSTDGSDAIGAAENLIVNIPLSAKLAVRLNAVIQQYPGITDYVNIYKLGTNGIPVIPGSIFANTATYTQKKNADDVNIGYGKIAIRFQPTEKSDFTLSYSRQHDYVGGRRQETVGSNGFGVPYKPYENGAVLLEPSKREVELASLEGVVDFGFATLTSSTSYYAHTGSSTSDNTGFYANDTVFHNYYYNYPRPAVPAYRSYGDMGLIEEARLVSAPGKTFDWVLGVFAEKNTFDQKQDSYVLGFQQYINAYFGLPAGSQLVAVSDHQFLYNAKQHLTDIAGFGELTWHATDRIQITGGLRHFHTDQETDVRIDFPSYAGVSNLDAPPTIKASDDKTLFKLNGSWKFDDKQLLYGTISQGYRRGGVNEVAITGKWAEDARWRSYRPDTVVNYEAGVKGQVLGLTYNAALYLIDWKDIQLNTFSDIYGFYVVANGKTAQSRGLEAQVEGTLAPRLRYSVGYTYTNAELTSNLLSPTGKLLASNGEKLPGTPENAVTVAADYNIPFVNDSRLYFHLSGYYQSSTRNALGASTAQQTVDLKGFQLWSANATWAFGSWNVGVFVKNIFNDRGVTGEFTPAYMGTNPGFPTAGNPNAANFYGNDSRQFISLPRTIGASLNYRW
jgi:outer membrane receptor protein involved in Fe transport